MKKKVKRTKRKEKDFMDGIGMALIRMSLDVLDEREIKILKLYYGLGDPKLQIQKDMEIMSEVSRARVQQIRDKVLHKAQSTIKEIMEVLGIKPKKIEKNSF